MGHYFLGVGTVRNFLIGLAWALIATPSWSQTAQQRTWCFSSAATDDETIDGCTALIQSGRETTNLPTEFYNRGIGYDGKGLYDQAIADDTQAIALKPDYAEAYDNRGFAYDDKGLYDQAIADYTQAIALKPDFADAYTNRGSAYGKKGLYDQAVADYTKAIALKPDGADAYSNRGLAYFSKDLYEQAIADYTRAIVLKPDYADAYDDRGNAYYKKGLYDQAIADFTQAIVLKPDFAYAYGNRGITYYRKGLYDQAIADYTKAIALKPDYVHAYANRARAYHQTGRDAQGLPDAEKAVALYSSGEPVVEIRAEIYEKLGRRDEAIADYRAALKLQPDLKSALDGLKRITATPAVAPGPSAVQPVAMIANPTWIATPDADMFARNYPARALRMNLEGHAVVECTVQADGALSGCSIVSEDPPGAGFGDAALQLMGSFRMAPRTADGRPVAGARVRVPVHWRTDD